MSALALGVRYLEANAVVAITFLTVALLHRLSSRGPCTLRASHVLIIARLLLFVGVLLPFFCPPASTSFLSPSAQIWSAPTMRRHATEMTEHKSSVVSVATVKDVPSAFFPYALWLLALVVVLTLAIRCIPSFRALQRLRRGAHRAKRIGRVEVLVSDDIDVPFSFLVPAFFPRALVFLPSALVTDSNHFRIALRHEIQHHRQRDTLWVYLQEAYRALFAINPLAHLFMNQLSEIQEFACDETLVDRKHVSPQAYGRCLLKVAETARSHGPRLVGTTSMAAVLSGSILKRRIATMMKEKKRYWNRAASLFGGLLSIALVATTAWAAQSPIQDRRITMSQAIAMADFSEGRLTIPKRINAPVLAELNRYLGTPDGRDFMRKALWRMQNHRAMIESKLASYQLPAEILAMPIIESGFQNLPGSANPSGAAGMWQFMPQTARNFGLQVDDSVDDRMDIEKETDAACRYLGSLYLRFQSWELAVLAYNAGENQVQSGIAATGSKDAWTLIDRGFGGDEGYLAKILATMLILTNPTLLE